MVISGVRRNGGRAKPPSAQEKRRFYEEAGRYTWLVAAESDLGPIVMNPRDQSKVKLFGGAPIDDRNLAAALRLLGELDQAPSPGSTLVDVGAHIGLLTLAALKRHGFGRVLALEADPTNYRLLRANLALGGVDDRVDAVNIAVGADRGSGSLKVHDRMHGKHSLVTGARAAKPGTVVDVEIRPLDGLLEERGVDPADVGLIKVDTEGHEAMVLRGAESLLAGRVPVLAEYAPFRLREREGGIEVFDELATRHFTRFADVRKAMDAQAPAESIRGIGELAELRRLYDGEDGRPRVTDVLLLP